MCTTCGCSNDAQATLNDGDVHTPIDAHGPPPHHDHSHDHGHVHGHDTHTHEHHHHAPPSSGAPAQLKVLEARMLAKNDHIAERNRGWFAARGVRALNVMGSPGSGKTTLLERTLRESGLSAAVIEGDQATDLDANRIRATGAPVVQVNTGSGCHLEANMVWEGVRRLNPQPSSTLFIENVGNLVCPALFDLGACANVVLFSLPEGDDKPTKYPHMFRAADLILLTKIDLLPHLPFDIDRAYDAIATINPDARVLQVSPLTGAGLDAWYRWIASQDPEPKPA